MKRVIACLLASMLVGCASVATGSSASVAPVAVAPINLPGLVTPAVAVDAASKNPKGGVRGAFVFVVKTVGFKHRRAFLDSASNYRYHDNLAIVMNRRVAKEVAERLNTSLMNLEGKRVVVRGVAKRVRIYMVGPHGRRTGRYYYQTHVRVDSPDQIRFAK